MALGRRLHRVIIVASCLWRIDSSKIGPGQNSGRLFKEAAQPFISQIMWIQKTAQAWNKGPQFREVPVLKLPKGTKIVKIAHRGRKPRSMLGLEAVTELWVTWQMISTGNSWTCLTAMKVLGSVRVRHPLPKQCEPIKASNSSRKAWVLRNNNKDRSVVVVSFKKMKSNLPKPLRNRLNSKKFWTNASKRKTECSRNMPNRRVISLKSCEICNVSA